MASNDLKVNVIFNAKTKQLEKTFKLFNKFETKLNQQANAQNTVTRAVQKTNAAHKKSGSLIDGLTKKVHRLANAYLGVMGARAALTTSDNITKAENKLNYLNASALGAAGYTTDANGAEVYSQATLNATQQSMDKMYTSAQKVRMEYVDMMTNVSKSMTLASGAFGDNIDNAIRFQEIMSEAYTLSGSSAAEMSSSMYQMIQGLGSGILQGDELRSVREGASLAYQAIEKYAQGIYGADKNLKDLAADGLITSDIVVKAILSNGEKMDEAFAKSKMTFEQAWVSIKNTAVKSFEPVLQKMNELLNSENGKKLISGIGTAIMVIAQIVNMVFTLVSDLFNWFVENWNWIKWIALSVLIAITIHLATMAYQAIATGIAAFIGLMSGLSPLYLWIILIGLIIAMFANLGLSFSEVCGYVVGIIMGALSIIWNLFVSLVTNILKYCLLPILQAWDNFANILGNLFNDPIAAIIHAFEGMADVILSMLQTIARGIDAIFGQNLSDKVQGWRDNLSTKADELANKYGKGTYEEKSALSDKVDALLTDASAKFLWNTSDAYNTGYGWGESAGNWITDKASGLKDKLSGALNMGGLPNEDIVPNLEDINGNTGKMADSMQLAEEDLKYLRDVANMEWKKEFTTANITVDMTNNNTVSNDYDLNSLAIGLRNLVEEEMHVVANGVYA